MTTSEKQIAANRLNALKSHGPKNTTSTQNNATKHGLLAAGITALDDAEGYCTILQELEQETNPVGTLAGCGKTTARPKMLSRFHDLGG